MFRVFVSALLLLTLALAQTAHAYTLRYTDASGALRVRWPSNAITITLSASLADPPPNVKASGSAAQSALINALRRWEKAANITFIINSSPKTAANSGDKSDGVNLVTIADTPENARLFAGPRGRDVARTRAWHDENGALQEADIALNPAQRFSVDGAPGTYDLEAVFAHEIGHFLGLGESTVLGATMSPRRAWNGLYQSVAWAGRTLSADDINGLAALYGSRGDADELGSINGALTWPGGQPAFGLNVWAEEWKTGRVLAGGITLANGGFRLEGLRRGISYRVMAGSLSGLLAASDYASESGAWVGLANRDNTQVYAEELGLVKLTNAAEYLPKQLRQTPRERPQASFIGLNGELADAALTMTAGQQFTLYFSGAGLSAANLRGARVNSPYFYIRPDSLKLLDEKAFPGFSAPVFSVVATVAGDAPEGDYSLALETNEGVNYLPGVLTVENASFAGLVKRRGNIDLAQSVKADKAAPAPMSGAAQLLTEIAGNGLRERE